MTDVFSDDRPIKPNKEYLQQKDEEYRQKKQFREFFKKHQANDKVLPCFRQNLQPKKLQSSKNSQPKTKAQIYEQIKRINIEKFGEKNDRKTQKQHETKNNKINPLKMTINYKHKSAIVIDTNEYKLKSQSQNQQNENIASQAKNTAKLSPGKYDETAKEKYEKLLNIMRKEKLELAKEKENFQKHKEKLQFKMIVQNEDAVPFAIEIKKNIQQKNKLKQSYRAECKAKKQNSEQEVKMNGGKAQSPSNLDGKKDQGNPKDLEKIQSRIIKLQQRKEQIQDEVYKNKRHIIGSDTIISTKYPLQQVNQMPGFDVECFKDFIDIRTLHPHGNEFYQIALQVFETGLNVKEAKVKLRVQNLDRVKENCEEGTSSIDYKRKYEGQTRITKYNNGWMEVWNPGVQRLMANKELCYKIVWLKNGDIRQEWKDRKLQSYYSKARQIVRLKFDQFQPIYYFIELNQIEQYNLQRKIKTVMFREGRVETFSTEEDNMNGFAV